MVAMEKLTKSKQNISDISTKYLCISVIILFISVCLVCLVNKYICVKALVQGSSMEDTYRNNDTVYVWKLYDIQRGDIVVFNYEKTGEILVKRCIGVPGDTVQIKDDELFVNNNIVRESYVKNGITGNPGILKEPITLKEDEYIVLGDNRVVSEDSRYFGVVRGKNIVGVVK